MGSDVDPSGENHCCSRAITKGAWGGTGYNIVCATTKRLMIPAMCGAVAKNRCGNRGICRTCAEGRRGCAGDVGSNLMGSCNAHPVASSGMSALLPLLAVLVGMVVAWVFTLLWYYRRQSAGADVPTVVLAIEMSDEVLSSGNLLSRGCGNSDT